MQHLDEDTDPVEVLLNNPIKSTVGFLLLFIIVQLNAQSLMGFMVAAGLIYGGLRYMKNVYEEDNENNDNNNG